MNVQIVATVINALSMLGAEVIRNRPVKIEPVQEDRLYKLLEEKPKPVVDDEAHIEYPVLANIKPINLRAEPKVEILTPEPTPVSVTINATQENRATAVPTGCIPCSLGHIGTCSGILNEAMRFARTDGISSPEVLDRVNICLDELNSLERKDLRPEMMVALPPWEKALALEALETSRSTRHELEDVTNIDRLEEIAAATQTKRQDIGRRWFQGKIANLTPEDKARIQTRVMEKLDEMKTPTPEEVSG